MKQNQYLIYMVLFTLVFILMTACAPAGAPRISGSTGLPVDENIYVLSGTVQAQSSLVRQTDPATGRMYGAYATFTGQTIEGKTFIRLLVNDYRLQNNTKQVLVSDEVLERGQIVIIKVVDTKATALGVGDSVTFLCRRQYEALARSTGETFDAQKFATWEFDYCRLESGIILNN